MASVSEEKTKGLTADKLMNIEGYPTAQNVTVDGVTWFKEDSYKNTAYHKLYEVFAKASKKQSMRSRGTPDFIVTLDNSEIIVVIECKGSTDDHMMFLILISIQVMDMDPKKKLKNMRLMVRYGMRLF